MSSTTARVEVLTAEVRVLQVGSRQVTMSVYAQLDRVVVRQLVPFGRVAPRDAVKDRIYVVGASVRPADKGALVRASCPTADAFRRRASAWRQAADRVEGDTSVNQDYWLRCWLESDPFLPGGKLDPARIRVGADGLDEAAGESDEIAALPLIVLAGLR